MDDFDDTQTGLNSPIVNADAITPDNAADLAHATRALYIGAGGDLRVTFVGGNTVTFTGLPGGVAWPFRVTRVHATGTTATGVIGLR